MFLHFVIKPDLAFGDAYMHGGFRKPMAASTR